MEWMQRWLDRRRVKALKRKIEQMKRDAAEAEVEPLMPAMETISHRIRLERLVVLERAAAKLDTQPAGHAAFEAGPAESGTAGELKQKKDRIA
jgi:hypothetical protein